LWGSDPHAEKKVMHNLHARQDSSHERAPALHERLKHLVVTIRRFQQGIDHFIPRPEIIPFVWQDDIDRSKHA
jgi:hypothetical protein